MRAASALRDMRDSLLSAIEATETLEEVEAMRLSALGKSGQITALLRTLGTMTAAQRQSEAPQIHALREAVSKALATRKVALEAAALEARLGRERIDLSLPALAAAAGSVHPVSQVMDELAEIFAELGFAVASGPEIEDDWHNFTALNLPETHPARALHDTFYFASAREATLESAPRSAPRSPRSAIDARIGLRHAFAYAHISGSDSHHDV